MSPDQEAEAAPVPDLLGSILSGQSILMMSSSDVVINRDGSLTAKKAGKSLALDIIISLFVLSLSALILCCSLEILYKLNLRALFLKLLLIMSSATVTFINQQLQDD